jgi:hypothetical protein
MTHYPIIISIKDYSSYKQLSSSIIKYGLPPRNYYELSCEGNALNILLFNKYGDPITSPKTIPKYNGDLLIFSKGFSDQKGIFPKEFQSGMFFSFDHKKGTGYLFNNLVLNSIIDNFFKPQRLFLFSCYQGKYLDNYLNGIPSLKIAQGFTSTIDNLDPNQELTKYFKQQDSYAMENAISRDKI